jgi:hypothetical protein
MWHAERETLELISRARERVPDFGARRLDLGEAEALADAAGIRASELATSRAPIAWGEFRGRGEFTLDGCAAHPELSRFLLYREVARGFSKGDADYLAELTFALVGHVAAPDPSADEAFRAITPIATELDQMCGVMATDVVAAAGRLLRALAAGVRFPLAAPDAYLLGRIARTQGLRLDVADWWYRRAERWARQANDWETLGNAVIGRAKVARDCGRQREARRLLYRAGRLAAKHGLREMTAWVWHDLLVVATREGDGEAVTAHCQAALRAYGAGHPALIVLAKDLAYFWMMSGRFGDALPIFRAVLPRLEAGSRYRMNALVNIVRAAAAVGEKDVVEETWNAAVAEIDAQPSTEGVAQAWLDLGHGARTLGDRSRILEVAGRALDAADRLRDGVVAKEARAMLAAHVPPSHSSRGPVHDLTEIMVLALEPVPETLPQG